ncbi:CBO0543 family protein [Aquibacillus sediminis]|uniref:CBO0543 family protein n=1 Tax=Aquibacillus sediminis TaxID=2574734 RepID=UPI00110966C5|nr:CBO0543 family protein [Aquibacillus sediminis]
MSRNKGILLIIWTITACLLVILVPKSKVRHAVVAFLFKQAITWLFGLLVSEKGLIKYPVRFFKKANKSSFSFEYFIYPSMCVVFNLYYPTYKHRAVKLLYYVCHAGFITISEILAMRYTNLIKYVKWKWYWSFITISMTYYSSHLFYRWFFKKVQVVNDKV